jgi:hypothetical protein
VEFKSFRVGLLDRKEWSWKVRKVITNGGVDERLGALDEAAIVERCKPRGLATMP